MSTPIAPTDGRPIRRAAETLYAWHQDLDRPLRVALISGGLSAEDQLYLADSPVDQLSVTALTGTLAALGIRFAVLDPRDSSFVQQIVEYDVGLSNLHGPYGEDGRLQGLVDWLRKPLCGSPVAACAVAADKILCKRIMVGLGVPTPPWQVSIPGAGAEWRGRAAMVKPSLGGSSLGMSLVHDRAALLPALEHAWDVDRSPVLVEEYIEGTPVTVGLLELPGGVLVFPPLATVVLAADFYDADAKLDADSAGRVTLERADFPKPVLDAVVFHARRLWDGLGCHGAARVDFIVTSAGGVHALEVNTTPGLSRESNFVTAARWCGLDLNEVVLAMLHEAMTRPAYDVPLPDPEFHTSAPLSPPAA
ncbi:D-alanine--D-alanine ligase family protein [Nocardia miyunensis]|uniref:D-alanine--D-alanine ligase family protein n=1 Tax=Nocardia miyunensis TaxID=282684 RepID=UPI000835036B|nr:ATP-grasp domain-containing protein [Nocardia miyunensis]